MSKNDWDKMATNVLKGEAPRQRLAERKASLPMRHIARTQMSAGREVTQGQPEEATRCNLAPKKEAGRAAGEVHREATGATPVAALHRRRCVIDSKCDASSGMLRN